MPRLFVIGDSTAASYPAEREPLTGWAQVLQDYFDPGKLIVHDKARSGRSSKSFMEEGAWADVRACLRPGDYVLIQFGHNDEKKQDKSRYTEPESTYREYLMTYVQETRESGATPFLATPIERNVWLDGATLRQTHGAYPDAVRAVARQADVALIDMQALTKQLLEEMGSTEAGTLFMNLKPGQWPRYPEGSSDNTHLQTRGAHAICRLFVERIREMDTSMRDALRSPAPGAKQKH